MKNAVYDFSFFYDFTDEVAQHRYVVAESEEAAWDKLGAYFEREGLERPAYISNPTVEIDYIII